MTTNLPQIYRKRADGAYPLAFLQVQAELPNVSFPPDPGASMLAAWGYDAVERTEPTYNPLTQRVQEVAPVQVSGQWRQAWLVEDLPAEDAAAVVASMRAALMERATAERWKHEEGGLALSNGVRVATTRDDQNRLTSVVANAALAGVESVDFKAASGWTTLTFAEVRGIAAAIALHVQACFSAERAHHQAIAALDTPEELANYDVTAGWPQSPE